MPIQVNEAYLRRLIDVLNNQISGEVVAAPGGPIDTVAVKAGFAFPQGEALEHSVTTQGSSVHQMLLEIGTLAATRANQLGAFIAMTNDADQVAHMSAADFGRRLPSWATGGAPAPGGPHT